MKKLGLCILLVATAFYACAQSQMPRTTKEMVAAVEGKYTLDDNNNVSYTRIVNTPEIAADQIYERALNYYVYNYGNGKSEIPVQDKDQCLLVGKGVFENVFKGYSFQPKVDVGYVLRVDVKDGKARGIITLTDFEVTMKNSYGKPVSTNRVSISSSYPINPKGANKAVMAEAFYNAINAAKSSLDKLESAIKNGNTARSIESSNW